MISVKRGVSAESIRLSSRHILFVEGASGDSIDPLALTILLDDTNIRVTGLGPSSYITSAAEALHPHHPDYYFLIDRDHRTEQDVERSWENFPNIDTHNLLIWRLRELESYFIDPEYLKNSQYLNANVNVDKMTTMIEKFANEHVFMDVANLVMIEIREELKLKWIDCLTNPQECRTQLDAIQLLTQKAEFASKKKEFGAKTTPTSLKRRFNEILESITNSEGRIRYNLGEWKKKLKGKPILNSVVNQCFKVKDSSGRPIEGREKLMIVVRELLRLDLHHQPSDFQELHRLIQKRVDARAGR